MSVTAKTALVVSALLIVMSVAWHFIAVGLQSNWLASVVTNSALCVLLATSVYRGRTRSEALVRGYALGAIVAVLLGVGAALAGALVYDSNHAIGDALMNLFSLGYYPPGPDVPFEIGAALWGLSIALLVSVGVAMGVAMRKFVPFKAN